MFMIPHAHMCKMLEEEEEEEQQQQQQQNTTQNFTRNHAYFICR